jgi:hypothetical protein
LEAEAFAFGAPEKWGRKRRHFHVLLELSNDRRICWSRSRAASSAEQRFKIHRSFRRHATLLEKRRSAIKTNIGDSLNVVIQIERRPGRRFISEVLEINGYDPDADLFDFCAIYVAPREHA